MGTLVVVRRLVWLALLGGAAVAGYHRWRQRSTDAGQVPEWPPFTEARSPTRTWIEPVDGECPLGHPLKANGNSNIFHEPGGRSYDRTSATRCYARAADAEADGYRAAKA